ncbi:MAG: hypothetical protein ACRD1T_24565 [Acidimicrobiia bacterium]
MRWVVAAPTLLVLALMTLMVCRNVLTRYNGLPRDSRVLAETMLESDTACRSSFVTTTFTEFDESHFLWSCGYLTNSGRWASHSSGAYCRGGRWEALRIDRSWANGPDRDAADLLIGPACSRDYDPLAGTRPTTGQ